MRLTVSRGGADELANFPVNETEPELCAVLYRLTAVAQLCNSCRFELCPGRETKAQQMAKCKDVIGEASGVGVMLLNPQIGLMVEQAIENMRGIRGIRRDHLRIEGCVGSLLRWRDQFKGTRRRTG